MEVKLEKRYPVAASVTQAWAVLSDVRATAACMMVEESVFLRMSWRMSSSTSMSS